MSFLSKLSKPKYKGKVGSIPVMGEDGVLIDSGETVESVPSLTSAKQIIGLFDGQNGINVDLSEDGDKIDVRGHFVKLWENPNPEESFSAQTIPDNTNYDAYMFVVEIANTNPKTCCEIIYNFDGHCGGTISIDNVTAIYTRDVDKTSNGFIFTIGTRHQYADIFNPNNSANYAIPVAIYGVNL